MPHFLFRSLSACLFTLVFGLVPAMRLTAQPGGSGPSSSLEVSYAHSGSADLEYAGRNAGDLSVGAFTVEAKTRLSLNPGLFGSAGLGWERYSIDADRGVPVPETLQVLKLDVGATFLLDRSWSVTIGLSPGFYSAGSSIKSDGFNVPVLALATWRASPTFSLSGGLRYDAFSDNEVLPFLGFRWQATPAMTVSLGAPRTEVAYTLREGAELFFGASFQGGGFHVDDAALAAPAGYPSLRDTEMAYREIRAGGGVRWALSPEFSIDLEAGWMFDRRFDYYDRSLEVKTDGAVFARVGVTARF
ncbi:MAG: TonB-dependent receptor [Opitutaceae bacterium]|nr:TonB-dependent receptor [Opitutaceae bacterium]